MSDQRIEILIKEINYWKEHKLLPTVYCDFLLALYTQGEGIQEEEPAIEPTKEKLRVLQLIQLFLLLLALLFSVLIIYAIELEFFMKLILVTILLLFSILLYALQKRSDDSVYRFTILVVLILILVISLFVTRQLTTYQWVINAVVITNFSAWFVVGQKITLTYLKVLSLLAVIFSILSLAYQTFA